MMKIGFVPILNFNTRNSSNFEFERCVPLGLISLIAVLEQNGIESDLIDINHHLAEKKVFPQELEEKALDILHSYAITHDILGFGTIGDSVQHTLTIAKRYKELHPHCTIILGGPHATLTACEILKKWNCVDIIVHGEAEQTILPLIHGIQNQRPLDKISGISFRDKNNQYCFTGFPALANLVHLPMPAYHKLKWLREAPAIPIDAGRGCPFSCTFCATSTFWKHKFRLKPVERIVHEIKTLKNQYGIDRFEFCHDIFTLNLKKVEQFCDALIAEKLEIRWRCSTRANLIPKELLLKMKQAGLELVFLGIETADGVLQKEIKKNLDVTQVRKTMKIVYEAGVHMNPSFIVGLPGENRDRLNATLLMAIEVAALYKASVPVQILSPYPDSELFLLHHAKLQFDRFYDNEVMKGNIIQSSQTLYSSFYSFPFGYYSRKDYRYLVCFYNLIHNHFTKLVWSILLQHQITFLDIFRCLVVPFQQVSGISAPG